MTKPPELKPCPVCGGEAELWNAHDNRPAWIACMGRCAVLISKEHKTDAEAIAAWNNRTPDPAVQALVEASREVYRISERDHVAWRKLSEALAALETRDD